VTLDFKFFLIILVFYIAFEVPMQPTFLLNQRTLAALLYFTLAALQK
jgi:hypothetical protein